MRSDFAGGPAELCICCFKAIQYPGTALYMGHSPATYFIQAFLVIEKLHLRLVEAVVRNLLSFTENQI